MFSLQNKFVKSAEKHRDRNISIPKFFWVIIFKEREREHF